MGVRHFPRHPEEERRRWQNPEEIFKKAGLKPGQVLVDIGCGDGFFALPAARTVGAKGKVYAVDVDEAAVADLRKRVETEKLKNLVLQVGRAEEAVLCEQCADFIFFGDVLHDFEDPVKVLANARKMVKSGGRLVDVDWAKRSSPVGPPMSIRFSPTKAERLIEQAGFTIVSDAPVGPWHYLILAEPIE